MFTGMALRMAQEIGLHHERTARGTSVSQSPTNIQETGEGPSPGIPREATQVYFSGVSSMDVNLCNGTCPVPCIKRHDISVRLPEDRDMAILRAGPGGLMKSLKPEGEHSWQLHVQRYRDRVGHASPIPFRVDLASCGYYTF